MRTPIRRPVLSGRAVRTGWARQGSVLRNSRRQDRVNFRQRCAELTHPILPDGLADLTQEIIENRPSGVASRHPCRRQLEDHSPSVFGVGRTLDVTTFLQMLDEAGHGLFAHPGVLGQT